MITTTLDDAGHDLAGLVAAVEERGETVVILRNGKPAARLIPASPTFLDHFREDARLRVIFHHDPMLPTDEEAWPEEFR
jgi:prevent-host-death family protein